MVPEEAIDRRSVISASVGLLIGAPAVAAAYQGAKPLNPDEGVTAPEDLMKEHGVLNRCLLIYEEGMRRLQGRGEVHPDVFGHTAGLVRKFVEEYHEKN